MFNTLNNFTYARPQPLKQRTNTYQTPKSRSKLDSMNCSGSGSLGKTVGILKRQNIRPKSPTVNQNDLYRTISSNSDYQLNFSKSANSSFFQQSQRLQQQQPQQIRNYKIITSNSSRVSKFDQIQILNEKIQRLTERVVSNEEQIFYLKSTKQSRLLPGLNMSDLKAIIQENQNQSQNKKDDNFISLSEQMKIGIERLRQELQKTVKKRDFQKEINDFKFKIRDLKSDISIQISEIAYQMFQKLKKQTHFSSNNLKTPKNGEQIHEKVFKLVDFSKKMEAEMERQMLKIKNLEKIAQSQQTINKNIQQKLKKRQPGQNSASNILYRSDFIFKSVPIKFTIQERLKFQKRQIKTAQTTYLIDQQGYLLDQQQYYLLNSLGEQIKLTEKQIKMLKNINVMV